MRPPSTISALLKTIYGKSFSAKSLNHENALSFFFSHPYTLADLHLVFRYMLFQELEVPHPDDNSRTLKMTAATMFGSAKAKRAIYLIAQVHGNEPIGLATILYAMVLKEAKLLDAKVYAAIGNRPAANFYWESYADDPKSPAWKRARTRTLVGEDDKIDLNRFLPEREVKARENRKGLIDDLLQSDNVMLRRGAKLLSIACQESIGLIFDPHSSRQEPDGIRTINISNRQMQFLERGTGIHKGLFKGVPEDIRIFPAGLLGKLGSSTPKITLKELFEAAMGDRQVPIIGIECGHHENLSDTIPRAVQFLNALLFNLGFVRIVPKNFAADNGEFFKYHVRGRLNLQYLNVSIQAFDAVYPIAPLTTLEDLPRDIRKVIVKKDTAQILDLSQPGNLQAAKRMHEQGAEIFGIYQFREFEDIAAHQPVMMGVPSGEIFTAPENFTVFFPSKSTEIYGNQPGMWPIEVGDKPEASKNAKFGYGIYEKESIVLK